MGQVTYGGVHSELSGESGSLLPHSPMPRDVATRRSALGHININLGTSRAIKLLGTPPRHSDGHLESRMLENVARAEFRFRRGARTIQNCLPRRISVFLPASRVMLLAALAVVVWAGVVGSGAVMAPDFSSLRPPPELSTDDLHVVCMCGVCESV